MLEVNEDITITGQRRKSFCECSDLLRAIPAAAAQTIAGMGAGALNFGSFEIVAFRNAQGGVVQTQDRVSLFAEPRLIAELEGDHRGCWSGKRGRGEKVRKQRGVGLEVWGKLEEQRAQLARGSHGFEYIDEPADDLVAVTQAAVRSWTAEATGCARLDSEPGLVRHRAVDREKIGAATGFRTQDIRCHRAAFCH